MNRESQLLLALSHLTLDAPRLDHARSLLAEHGKDLAWGSFLDRAARHRVLPLIGRHVTQHRLFHSETGTSVIPYHWLYESVYEGNLHRNQTLAEEFGNVIDALGQADIPYAIRKGPVISEHLYSDVGLRRMSDLDVLVDRAQAKAVGRVLTELGYQQGKISQDGVSVEEFSRRTRLFWRTNVPNELPYVKIAHTPYVETFDVDICLNIFQPLGKSRVPVSTLLERRTSTELCGRPSYALSPADHFIDLCAHLHKEATALYYIEDGTDLELQKFLDISLSCAEITQHSGWAQVRSRAEEYAAGRSVYYALHHTAVLYPETVPTAELEYFRPYDTGYLDEYGEFDGAPGRWQQSFLERLFDADRGVQVMQRSTVPQS